MIELALILTINADVNASIRFEAEAPGRDVWTVAPAVGDCEDFALTKYHRLLEAGVPASEMAVTIVRHPGTDVGRRRAAPRYHAVLVVRGLVLDNERRGRPVSLPFYRSSGWTVICKASDLSEGENPGGALARCEGRA